MYVNWIENSRPRRNCVPQLYYNAVAVVSLGAASRVARAIRKRLQNDGDRCRGVWVN